MIAGEVRVVPYLALQPRDLAVPPPPHRSRPRVAPLEQCRVARAQLVNPLGCNLFIVMAYIVMALYSHGPCSYGLHSYGLCSYGLYSYGLYSYGPM